MQVAFRMPAAQGATAIVLVICSITSIALASCRRKTDAPFPPPGPSLVPSEASARTGPCQEGTYRCQGESLEACVGGQFAVAARCLGPEGCRQGDASVSCDDTRAELGSACDTEAQRACDVDGGAVLRCLSKRFVRERVCGAGCVPGDAGVFCMQ